MRPGANPVPVEEELSRTIQVVKQLAEKDSCVLPSTVMHFKHGFAKGFYPAAITLRCLEERLGISPPAMRHRLPKIP